MGRQVVEQYFSEHLKPDLTFDHNSAQHLQLVSDAVRKVLAQSLFLKGPVRDRHVSYLFHGGDLLIC
jgi:hypothetical protein